MRFSENRTIAFVVLAVCVLGSIFGLGGMGLAKERGNVLTVYDRGADTSLSTRHSMDAYLDSAAEAVNLMVSEAELHLKDNAQTDTVSELAGQLANSDDLDVRYKAYSDLKTAVDKLYNAMYEEAKGNDFTNFKKAYDDFWGYDDLIRHDEYPKMAADYNSLINGIPGSIVAAVTGQGKLNTFGG